MKEILVDKNGNEIKNGDKVRIIIDKIDYWGNYFHDGIYDVEFSKDGASGTNIIIADDEKQQRVMDEIKEKVKGVYITSCIDYLIEISNEKGGKHSGLKYMMELLGLKREEVAAFGDAENDMDMLKFAGIGIAMENACESCKEIADFVTKHHDEDGVAYGIYEILKI